MALEQTQDVEPEESNSHLEARDEEREGELSPAERHLVHESGSDGDSHLCVGNNVTHAKKKGTRSEQERGEGER